MTTAIENERNESVYFREHGESYPLPDPGFVKMRKYAKAYGMSRLAHDMGISRRALYTILSRKGNPTLHNLFRLIKLLDFKVSVQQADDRRQP